ncbi:phage late control D family protein [bacterium]|nr:MAG: phage late control D family protein [bacterium]
MPFRTPGESIRVGSSFFRRSLRTMAVEPLRREAALAGEFHVPQFEVRIDGVGLPRNVLRDVVSVTYKDNVAELDGFELVVNNWDPTESTYKYVGADTSITNDPNPLHSLFDPRRHEIVLKMGYVDRLKTMLTGSTSTIEPNFPMAGLPVLNVRGLNKLHELRTKQYTTTWNDKTDSQIAANIATLSDRDTGQRRFPFPIEADTSREETPRATITQQNQYDIDFLVILARRNGYVVFLKEADDTHPTPRLYFGPPQAARAETLRDVTYELAYGLSLMEFKPTLSTANQFVSVTVKGRNRTAGTDIRGTVRCDDARITINRDLAPLLSYHNERAASVVSEPVATVRHAEERAAAILTEKMRDLVTATGRTVGLPELRAGQKVHIKKVGKRFEGIYLVTESTHIIDANGYVTAFTCKREGPLP